MLIQDIFNKLKYRENCSDNNHNEPVAYNNSDYFYNYFSGEKDYFAMNSSKEYNVDYYLMANICKSWC